MQNSLNRDGHFALWGITALFTLFIGKRKLPVLCVSVHFAYNVPSCMGDLLHRCTAVSRGQHLVTCVLILDFLGLHPLASSSLLLCSLLEVCLPVVTGVAAACLFPPNSNAHTLFLKNYHLPLKKVI